MKLMELLNSEEFTTAEKLERLNSIVEAARESYGNTEVEVDVPFVDTVDGSVRLNMLTNEDKIAIATGVIRTIATDCIEYGEDNKAIVLDKSIEEAIATNAILINLDAESGSKYL